MTQEEKEKMEFGTKMHEVFEYLDFKNPNIHSLPISDYFKAKIEKFLSLIDTKDIINVYKEYEFSYEKDDNYFHGIIDLILEYEDKIKIIDYKLKNIDDEKHLQAQRETFVASLGHDFKNPTLAQIRAVELLLK